MPYIFLVNETNRHICVQHRLFGVPATDRARSQISSVVKGDQLFLYIYGTGLLYGPFRAESNPFLEKHPEQGPWNLSPVDKKHGYYPYRLHVSTDELRGHGIPFKKIERFNIGLNTELLQRKSVVYASPFQAHIFGELLRDLPVEREVAPVLEKDFSHLESIYTRTVQVTDSQEKALQLLVQKNFEQLEEGVKPVTSYFNVQYGTIRGEIDILGQDKERNYVVTELKAENLKKDIWTQLLTYSHVIRDIYAKHEGVEVRSFLICPGFDRKTFYSYPELKKLLKKQESVRVFKYDTNFKDRISFEEIPIMV